MTTEQRKNYFLELMGKGLGKEKAKEMEDVLDGMGFFTAPASARFHGAYPGGLFDHSTRVTENLLQLTRQLELKWGRPESPYLVGMLHDLCKIDAFAAQPDGSYLKRQKLMLTGHGDKSVMIAQELANLTVEEMLCIRWHMGGYDDSKHWNTVGAAIETYPNVLWTHTADMMAARIDGI